MYLGQSNKSGDATRINMVIDIKTGLTPIIKRLFDTITRENSTRERFITKKACCHPFPKKTFNSATTATGTVQKNDGVKKVF